MEEFELAILLKPTSPCLRQRTLLTLHLWERAIVIENRIQSVKGGKAAIPHPPTHSSAWVSLIKPFTPAVYLPAMISPLRRVSLRLLLSLAIWKAERGGESRREDGRLQSLKAIKEEMDEEKTCLQPFCVAHHCLKRGRRRGKMRRDEESLSVKKEGKAQSWQNLCYQIETHSSWLNPWPSALSCWFLPDLRPCFGGILFFW